MTSALDLLVLQVRPIAPADAVPVVAVPVVAATAVAAPAVAAPAVAMSIPAMSIPAMSIPAMSIPAMSIPATTVPATTVPTVTDTGAPTSTAPKRLAVIREFVAKVAAGEDGASNRVDADVRLAATLLGWIAGEPAIVVTAAGTRLLHTESGSSDESAAFAAAILEQPPLCRIAGAVLLGEWLGLHDLAPALVRELGLHAAQASRLVPCVLAWRDELRTRGWTVREAALHLRSRTAWMTGLSSRARDVIARLGVITREQVLATESGSLRDAPGCRLEMVREIERFRAQLGTLTVAPARSAEPVPRDVPAPSPTVRRKRRAPAVDTVVDDAPDAMLVSASVLATARRVAERRGCASIGAMAREFTEPKVGLDELREILAADAGVRWLDADHAWFWIPDVPRNRMLERIAEADAVPGEIAAAELRATLMQDRTIAGDVPPSAVFVALYEQLAGQTIEGTRPRKARRREPAAPSASAPVVVLATPEPAPILGGDSSIADLAHAAGMTMDEVVALALSDVGRKKPRGTNDVRGGGRSRR